MKFNKSTLKIDLVPENKSKIKFDITFAGEWDWNIDFVLDPGVIQYMRGEDFKIAFFNYVSNEALDRCGNMFKNAKLTSMSYSKEVEQTFKQIKKDQTDNENNIKQEKLKRLKEEATKLEKELSKKK